MAERQDIQASLADDGYVPAPDAMAELLYHLTRDTDAGADYYGNGGAVADFENTAAQLLGKERAAMFPTGTLANLIAMRRLAGLGGGRIIVHRQSHFFNDSGDNLSQLGGFTTVHLDGKGAGISARDVETEIERAADARVASRIGCIAVESPNRRLFGQRFSRTDINAIAGLAADRQIPLFLDGARMLIECAYTGQQPADMAAPFEVVYLSLYKYLGAPFGCILAGPAKLLDAVFHERRRFGGSLYQMWPAAVLASHALAGFEARWQKTRPAAEAVIEAIEADGFIRVERVPNGTNIVMLSIPGAVIDGMRTKAAGLSSGLKLPDPDNNRLPVKINETWLNLDPEEIAEQVTGALKEGIGNTTRHGVLR